MTWKTTPPVEDSFVARLLDPQLAHAYFNRGLAYSNLGEQQRAFENYNTTIRLDPQFAQAYFNRGNAYARRISGGPCWVRDNRASRLTLTAARPSLG